MIYSHCRFLGKRPAIRSQLQSIKSINYKRKYNKERFPEKKSTNIIYKFPIFKNNNDYQSLDEKPRQMELKIQLCFIQKKTYFCKIAAGLLPRNLQSAIEVSLRPN